MSKQITKKIDNLIPGIAYYARVHKPHGEDNKYDAGKFTIALKVSDQVLSAIKAAAIAFGKEVLGKEPKLFFIKDLQKDNISGVLQAKTKIKPPVHNALGDEVSELTGNGSEVLIGVTLNAFNMLGSHGVSLYLNKVVVDKLVEYKENDKPASDGIKLDFGAPSSIDF